MYNPATPMAAAPSSVRFFPALLASLLFGLLLASPAALHAQAFSAAPGACTSDDVVRSGIASGRGLEGFPGRVGDGSLALEGSAWNDGMAVQIPASARLNVDLRATFALQYFVLQGDDNDSYVVEGSEDGINYRVVWTAPPANNGQGLRTRYA